MDQILAWAVIVLPTLFAVGMALMDDRVKTKKSLLMTVIAFGVVISGLTALQMWRAGQAAERDKERAISETSSEVSSSVSESVTRTVTKTLGDQYASTINQLQGNIASLEAQLAAQGKKVDVISGSDMVTGRNPVKVEVTNPVSPSPSEPSLQIRVALMNTTPEPKYGKNAMQLILTTNKVMNGAKAQITCKAKLNSGRAWLANSGMVMGGSRTTDDHTFVSSIVSPNWAPDYPLVITLFTDDTSVGPCDVKVLP